MGVDSGLPDFRGPEGFWRAYPPYRALGLDFAEIADPVHFADDPELAWGFYGHRLGLYRATVPHAGFTVLRGWGLPTRVFTSNVDGQFQRAGFDGVAECHGSIHHLQCLVDCGQPVWSADGTVVDVDETTMRARTDVPSDEGWETALHHAAHTGDAALARLLLDLGADPEARDHRFDATPLDWARHAGRPELVELLTAGRPAP
jgi:hypothetical protein